MKSNDVSNGIRKSNELILRLYEVSFRDIFVQFFEKMKSFEPFFEGFENFTSINNDLHDLAYLDENLSKQEHIVSISATCKGQKWKHQQTETAVLRLDFIVEFQNEVYKIKANGLSFEKSYIELLTGEEIDNLIQAVGKLGLEKIKNVVH